MYLTIKKKHLPSIRRQVVGKKNQSYIVFKFSEAPSLFHIPETIVLWLFRNFECVRF